MKVLLINPPFYRFMGLEQDYVPLSLLAVGSMMEKEGHEVFIKNLEVGLELKYVGYEGRGAHYSDYIKALKDNGHYVWNELEDLICNMNPDWIGINVLNVKYQSALKIIEIAKNHGKKVIVGGNHPTMDPQAYYGHDVLIKRGEYESPECGRLENLDDTPYPNYDLLLDTYSPDGYAHILSSRGCPYNCRFCASQLMWNRKVTYKSVDRILGEMEHIHLKFEPEWFTFWDEVFTLNKKRLTEFCDKYNIPGVKWRCDTRADVLTYDMVKMMKDAGCGQMSIGVECADDDMLKYIGKNETTDDFIKAADIFNKHEIQWKAYMIIGFPEDTVKTIERSLQFVKSLCPFRITLSFFTPYKGTDLYDECRTLGLIDNNYDEALFSHQSPHNYFCPKIGREEYIELKDRITKDIDDYNRKALLIWK